MPSSNKEVEKVNASVFPWNAQGQGSPPATARKHRVDERTITRKRDEEELELVTLDEDIVVGNGVETAVSNVELTSDVGVQTMSRPAPVDSETQIVNSLTVEPVKATGSTVRECHNEPVAVQFYTGLENYELSCNNTTIDTTEKILQIINNDMEVLVSRHQVEWSHRLGPKVDRNGKARQRNIIIRFNRKNVRDSNTFKNIFYYKRFTFC